MEATIRVRLQFLVFVTQITFPRCLDRPQSLCSLPQGGIRGDSKGQVALLSRTNANVFDEAVRVTEGEVPARIHLIGVGVRVCPLLSLGNLTHTQSR